jgi:hypothetical protein
VTVFSHYESLVITDPGLKVMSRSPVVTTPDFLDQGFVTEGLVNLHLVSRDGDVGNNSSRRAVTFHLRTFHLLEFTT